VWNAVVWLEDAPNGAGWGKALPKVEMDQKGCVFVPRVVVVPVGGTVDFLNSDRLLHNLHSKSKENVTFNRTKPHGRVIPVTFNKPEIVTTTATCTHGCAGRWSPSTVLCGDRPEAFRFQRAARKIPSAHVAGSAGSASREVVVDAQGATVTFDADTVHFFEASHAAECVGSASAQRAAYPGRS
jgi:plastocyanin